MYPNLERGESSAMEAAFGHAPVAMFVVNPAGWITRANGRARDLLGPLVEQRWRSEPWFQRVLSSGRPVEGSEVVWERDGAPLRLELSAAPCEPHGLVVSIRERPQVALEERLRTVVDHAAVVLFAMDDQGTFLLSEGKGLEKLGLEPGQVVGIPVDVAYADNPRLLAHARRALAGEAHTAIDVVPGLDLVFETRWTPLWDEQHRLKAVVGVAVDISERRRAEMELQSSLEQVVAQRQLLELAVANIVDPVFIVDAERRLTLANAAAYRLIDTPEREALGQSVADIGPRLRARSPAGEELAADAFPILRALSGEIVIEDELTIETPGGGLRHVRFNAAPIRKEGRGVTASVTIARDVTGTVDLDRMKDDLLLIVAHELRTPVTVMKGYSDLLQQSPVADHPTARRLTRGIVRGTERLRRTVDDIVVTAELVTGRLQLEEARVDLGALVDTVLAELSRDTGDHRLRVTAQPTTVCGDPNRLGMVVRTLVDNAIKYSPAGGTIEVRVETRGESGILSVTDPGIGIPKPMLEAVFDRFCHPRVGSRYDYGGLGIELYLARQLVAAHGGSIEVESEEGIGSTFTVTLPLEGERR